MSKVIKSFAVKLESPMMIENEELLDAAGKTSGVNDTGNSYSRSLDGEQGEECDSVPDITYVRQQAGDILRETEEMVKELIETARQEAEKIIRHANEEAARIIAEGQVKAKSIEEDAQNHGWQDGYQRGIRIAGEEYNSKLEEAKSLVEKAYQDRQEIIAGSEDEIVQLAMAVARKVVGHELAATPDIIVGIVKRAIQKATDREELTVRVNPENLDSAFSAQEEISHSIKGVRKLKFLADPAVAPGGCVVESPNGTVDARIERQLSELEQALMEVGPNA